MRHQELEKANGEVDLYIRSFRSQGRSARPRKAEKHSLSILGNISSFLRKSSYQVSLSPRPSGALELRHS
jgi:hypothetical protein